MGTEVVTRTTCDRCGLTDERKSAEGSVPPVSWAFLTITTRHEGGGWTNSSRTERTLCPECTGIAVLSTRSIFEAGK